MNLKDWRVKRRMTQSDAAALIGVDQGLLSKWERGVTIPGGRWMAEIAAATLGRVTAADFVAKKAVKP